MEAVFGHVSPKTEQTAAPTATQTAPAAPTASQLAPQVSEAKRDEVSLLMEARRKKWLAEKGLAAPATTDEKEQETSNTTNTWVAPEAAPPGKVVECADGTATGTAPGFKIVNFDRPMPKPTQNEMVMPWKSTVKKGSRRRVADPSEVMSVASSKDGTATEPKTVKDLHAFWGKKDRKARTRAKKASTKKAIAGAAHNLSKIEAQATLQRQFTSGNRVDWDEVRKLRKIIAESGAE